MSRETIETVLRVGIQYLNPQYNNGQVGGLNAQVNAERGTLDQVFAVLTRHDQTVRPVVKAIQKARLRIDME